MKNLFSKGLVVSSVLLVLISCKKEESAASAIDTNKIKEEIQAKENEFADTYNSGVMKQIGYFADDAVTFPQNHEPVSGKSAIIEYLKAHIDTVARGRKIAFTTNEVFVSKDGEQVVELGSYTISDSTKNLINSGNYMTLFVKKDGKYYSLRDISTSDLPTE
ncbi:YybH family protein [Flavobacterium gilvum]|uniref:DUF4440 domain-containing protein n=1 Tax=Flavobacterium gilvum TaxID=1492737 RepID=A0AAC9I4R2_9FLAO|nr:nuclear transport factor 2 family protein [Flavobacterium gilvum]AOW08838.1 hypothetical protein EM308_04585 [Flavobacterium gilvum]